MSANAALLERPRSEQIGSLARRGAAWTFALVTGRYAFNICATAVLARLLTSTDYGLLGMVVTLTAFFQVFSEMGLSWVTVQKADLTRKQLDNLFWINTAAGALLWAACASAGPFLNAFYRRSELSGIALWLGAGFLLSGLAVQPTALLRRQMRLKTLSLCEAAGQVSGAVAGVALAVAGFGYWSLVGQSLAAQLTLLAFLFHGSHYRPGAPAAGQRTTKMLGFGAYLTAFAILTYIARTLDNVLIGRYWGAEELGYYSRAYFLMVLPSALAAGTLSGVMVPALSALMNDRPRMHLAYVRSLRAIGIIGFPIAVGFLVTAPEIVRLVYGPRWLPVVPLLVWLSVASITQPVYITIGWLYIPCGKVRSQFFWGLLTAVVLSITFAVGVRHGAEGVAKAYGLVMAFGLTLPGVYCAHRAAGFDLLPSMKTLARPFLASAAMGVAAWLTGLALLQLGATWRCALCAKVLVGITSYAGICGPRTIIAALRPS